VEELRKIQGDKGDKGDTAVVGIYTGGFGIALCNRQVSLKGISYVALAAALAAEAKQPRGK
jgi:hypothetical protein